MISKGKAINKIMREFNFRAVRDVMKASNITWKKNDEEYIPSEGELRLKAEEMLKSAAGSSTNYCRVSGNGFIATKRATTMELIYSICHCWG